MIGGSTKWDIRFNFCPGKYVYDLREFHWDKETQTLSAKECNLFPIRNCPNPVCFPNNGQKFYIANPKTKQFRRFVLEKETDKYYYFKFNKAGTFPAVYCMIKKQAIELVQIRKKPKKKRIFKFNNKKKIKKWNGKPKFATNQK
jgi:hypothetical protein